MRSSTQLGRNTLANVGGQVLVSAIQVLMIPQYVGRIGVEAWGLFGFYVTVQAFAQLLDFGMTATVNRELARASVHPEAATQTRTFLRTSEVGYGLIGLAIGAMIVALAPWIADRWFHLTTLPHDTLTTSVRLIGVLTAVQWPMTFYQGALLGLQCHALANGVRVASSLVSAAGAIALLTWVSPTIITFFALNVLVSTGQVLVLAVLVWRQLPGRHMRLRARVQPASMRGVARFASGMMALTMAGVFLSQSDRVVLSRVVSLERFGYFTLGAVPGQGLSTVVTALFATMFPTFARLVAAGDRDSLGLHYLRMMGVVTAVLVPAAAVVSLFSVQVLMAWTGDLNTASIAAPVAALLALGTALNGLMSVGYALQLARGETAIALRIYIALCLLSIPALWALPQRYGILGGAMIWPLVNVIYVGCGLMARTHWFPRELPLPTLMRASVFPALTSVLTVLVLRQVLPMAVTRPLLVAQLGCVWAVGVIAVVVTNPDLRGGAIATLHRRRHLEDEAFQLQGRPD